MKSYEQINGRIEAKKVVVLTAEEIIEYVDRKGLEQAAREVDVVTTVTFGAMCSSGCFLNFGHSQPRVRITLAWIDGVPVFCDCYVGQPSPLLNDPLYETIGIGAEVWLAGAQGHVYAEGTSTARAASGAPTTCPPKGRAPSR